MVATTSFPRLPVPPSSPRCRTSQLEVAFTAEPPAAGNLVADFELRNRSTTGCWVYGYVGFVVLDQKGVRMSERLSHSTDGFFGKSEQPTRIQLPANTAPLGADNAEGHSFFNVETDDVLCSTDSINAIAALQIWPPDETTPLTLPARHPDGAAFASCGMVILNPLQVQRRPRLG